MYLTRNFSKCCAGDGEARSSQELVDLLDVPVEVELRFTVFPRIHDDYGSAVLRFAWLVDRRTRERALVCASIEMVPREIPPPPTGDERWLELSRRHFLYARDVVLSGERALEWYRDCRAGKAVRPLADGSVPPASSPGVHLFQIPQMVAEPDTTLLVTNQRVPFSADRQESPRVQHLMPSDSSLRERWTTEEEGRAKAWLRKETYFDFDLFPEYLGSATMLAPNPLFRSLLLRLDDSISDDAVTVVLEPRRGADLRGLELVVEDERPTGLRSFAARLEGPILTMRFGDRPRVVRERVICPERGLLFEGGPSVFDLGLDMRVGLGGNRRRVRVPPAAHADAEVYEVPLTAMATRTRVPGRAPPLAVVLLDAGVRRRRENARAKTEQLWFRDQARDAVLELRKLVGRASFRVEVFDPYFVARDLNNVVLATTDPDVHVRILASARALGRRGAGDDLAVALQEARQAEGANRTEVRVLSRNPALHDRFLRIDDDLWALGSSLGRFGLRGTLLMRVAVPDPFTADLELLWQSAPAFEDWLTEHRARTMER